MNKKLTIADVEKLKATLNTTIAEAIQAFEVETGMRIGYIDTVRKRDQEKSEGKCTVEPYNEDRGEVVAINANVNMEF